MDYTVDFETRGQKEFAWNVLCKEFSNLNYYRVNFNDVTMTIGGGYEDFGSGQMRALQICRDLGGKVR